MSDMKTFIKIVKEENRKRKAKPKTKAEELKRRILQSKTNDGYLKVQQEVKDFFASDASEEDKEMLSGYTESLNMICSAIKEKPLKGQ
ncbi:MAG: hypothetical protein E6686_04855 [Lachnospiraceae bacterium]|nr:hypothetical protein [Lachnospiraceae bacterium]